MMETANFRIRDDARAVLSRLCLPRRWRVLGQRKMCTRPLVVIDVSREHTPQVPLVQGDEMVQTLAPDGSDQSLSVRILPRARRSAHDFADAHTGHMAPERITVDGVPVSHKPSWCGVVRK